jgi:dihydroneopterin aldolase
MTDIIFLRNLHIDTLIGIFDWERSAKQTLIFDIEMDKDPRGPNATNVVVQ